MIPQVVSDRPDVVVEPWPRGWWASTGGLVCVACSEEDGEEHVLTTPEPMFLTGEPGEAFCAKHGVERDGSGGAS